MNFLEAIFSFVFGDGDPNAGMDTKRWAQVGSIIQRSGGVVVAEQVAPYVNMERRPDVDGSVPDESHMIPVLQRFEGEPIVDDVGNLLYWFPKLQEGGASGESTLGAQYPRDGGFWEESTWRFSGATIWQKVLVVVLGAINLAGVWALVSLFSDLDVAPTWMEVMNADEFTGKIILLTIYLLPSLKLFASLIFAVPAVRLVCNFSRNVAIKRRNELRRQAAAHLNSDAKDVVCKLSNAAQLAASKVDPRTLKVVYTTEIDLDLQEDRYAVEFDQKLGKLDEK